MKACIHAYMGEMVALLHCQGSQASFCLNLKVRVCLTLWESVGLARRSMSCLFAALWRPQRWGGTPNRSMAVSGLALLLILSHDDLTVVDTLSVISFISFLVYGAFWCRSSSCVCVWWVSTRLKHDDDIDREYVRDVCLWPTQTS